MTTEAHQRKNTLRRFTNGDSFETFNQQWAISQDASVVTLCQILHRQWLNLFTIIPSPRKFAECLYCTVSPSPILHVLSRSIESPVTYSSYDHTSCIHTFIHQYFHIFIYAHFHAYTTYAQYQFTHGCISHPKSWSVVIFRFSSYLLCFKWQVLNNGHLSLSYHVSSGSPKQQTT